MTTPARPSDVTPRSQSHPKRGEQVKDLTSHVRDLTSHANYQIREADEVGAWPARVGYPLENWNAIPREVVEEVASGYEDLGWVVDRRAPDAHFTVDRPGPDDSAAVDPVRVARGRAQLSTGERQSSDGDRPGDPRDGTPEGGLLAERGRLRTATVDLASLVVRRRRIEDLVSAIVATAVDATLGEVARQQGGIASPTGLEARNAGISRATTYQKVIAGELAAIEAWTPRAPERPMQFFDQRCADRLADEVAILIRRRILDARSPAADALLDYRDGRSPSNEQTDRIAALEAEVDRLRAQIQRRHAEDVDSSTRAGEEGIAQPATTSVVTPTSG
jgi:hypothetical protein